MDENIFNYRLHHPRCVYCAYADYECIPGTGENAICRVTLKSLGGLRRLYRKGMFCPYYSVKK